MNKKLAFLLSASSLFVSGEVRANAVCNIVPSCESLGYVMNESECSALDDVKQMLKCPFDESMVFCLEDCRTYPIVNKSCDSNKGTCVKCMNTDRWKYLDCNEGYALLDGDCKRTNCDKDVYIYNDSNKPDEIKGTIVSCKTGSETRYGYSSCNEGWELVGANCIDVNCGSDYVVVDECPNNAECSDRCMSGTTEKVNFTCNDGLVRQGLRCLHYPIGSVYEYNGVPIGVVFYTDDYTTKIIALHDIDDKGKPVETQSSDKKMTWSKTVNNIGVYYGGVDSSKNRDGFENTKKILEFVNYTDSSSIPTQVTQAAIATYLYHPEVCGDTSLCREGRWYLPAIAEQRALSAVYKQGTPFYDALHDTGIGAVPLSSDNDGQACYWSSNEFTSKFYEDAYVYCFDQNKFTYKYKNDNHYVRPVLAIQN